MSVNKDNNGASCRVVGRVSQVYISAQDSIWQGQCSPSVTCFSYCCHWTWADVPNGCFLLVGQAIITLLPQPWAEWNCLWSNQLQAWHPDLTQGEYEEQCSDFGGSPTFNISQKRRVFKKILLTLGLGSCLTVCLWHSFIWSFWLKIYMDKNWLLLNVCLIITTSFLQLCLVITA